MADTPLPNLPATPPGQSSPTEGIQTQANGQPASQQVTPEVPKSQPDRPTLREWAVYRLVQLGALLGLWLVLFVVLILFDLKWQNALGFSIILSLIASFFLRSLLPFPSPAEKHRPATQHHPAHAADSVREIVETVVFVVVLVLMLKSFVAE